MRRVSGTILACSLGAFAFGACAANPDEQQQAPVARDDQLTIGEDDPGTITPQVVEANDTGEIGGFTVVDPPSHGSFDPYDQAYAPDPGFHGVDGFTYEVYGPYGTSVARAAITVTSDGIPDEQATEVSAESADGLRIADLDGDGRLDLVTFDHAASTITVLQNTGTGPGEYAFVPTTFEGGHAPTALAVADLDGDGLPDVVTASADDGLVVLRNETTPGGPLRFDQPSYLPDTSATDVVTADLDGDGLADLASIDDTGLRVHLNESTPGNLAFGPDYQFATPYGADRVEAVDADGLAPIDLIVLSPYPETLSLFVNATAIGDQVPSFAARDDRATGPDPRTTFVADLDGDLRPEIGVVGDGGLWIYANQSATPSLPSYEAARVLDLGTAVATVVPVDLDGQGNVDLEVAPTYGEPLIALINQTTEPDRFVFEDHPSRVGEAGGHTLASFGTPTAMAFADLDGVAPAEIVVASTDGVEVLFGD